MSWTLTASGHAETPTAEAALVANLHELFGKLRNAPLANIYTSNFGPVNLAADELPESVTAALLAVVADVEAEASSEPAGTGG